MALDSGFYFVKNHLFPVKTRHFRLSPELFAT